MRQEKLTVDWVKSGIECLFDPRDVDLGVFHVGVKAVNGNGAGAEQQKKSDLTKVGGVPQIPGCRSDSDFPDCTRAPFPDGRWLSPRETEKSVDLQ